MSVFKKRNQKEEVTGLKVFDTKSKPQQLVKTYKTMKATSGSHVSALRKQWEELIGNKNEKPKNDVPFATVKPLKHPRKK